MTFDFPPPESVSALLGRVKCRLSVSPLELERDDNAIAVLCHGFLHAVTLAGRGRDPLVEYIFGEVEVPSLDDDPGPVPPFDNTRSLALNQHNPRVQVLEAWLGECMDEVLAKLEEREKRRRSDRERRLLKRVAGRIKSLLDEDFQEIQAALPWANLPVKPRWHPAAVGSIGASRCRYQPPNVHPDRDPSLIKRSLQWLKRLFKGKNDPGRRLSPARLTADRWNSPSCMPAREPGNPAPATMPNRVSSLSTGITPSCALPSAKPVCRAVGHRADPSDQVQQLISRRRRLAHLRRRVLQVVDLRRTLDDVRLGDHQPAGPSGS